MIDRRARDPRWVKAVILLVGVLMAVLLVVADAARPSGHRVMKFTAADSACYFATARSLLCDRDFDLTNEFAVLQPEDRPWTRIQSTGKPGSPYAIGYSLLELPFLAIGTAADRLAGRPADGYGRGAVLAYFLGHVVFVTLGLLCVFDTLARLAAEAFPRLDAGLRQTTALFATLLLLPATTLGVYAFSPMSHAAGFLSVALFLRTWVRNKDSPNVGAWFVLGLCAGLAALCRWQNVLFWGAPLLADLIGWKRGEGSSPSRAAWWKTRGAFLAAAVACLLPQLIQWNSIYGQFLLIPQGGDFLQFPPRFVAKVLFSTRHGWFIWTPACALCVAGLLWGCRERPRLFVPWTLGLAAEIVVMGSMPTNWYNQAGFGIRSLTCSLPVAAMGLLYLLLRSAPAWRRILAVGLVVCAAYTAAFAVQYRLDMIDRDDYLTLSELLTDKLTLPRALERHKVRLRCEELTRQGRPGECAEIAEPAMARLGEGRRLLRALAKAQRAAGNTTGEQAVRERLQAFMDKRLW